MTEHWKINILRNHLKTLKEEGEKGTITRDEKRDIELKIYYYQLGVEFSTKNHSQQDNTEELGQYESDAPSTKNNESVEVGYTEDLPSPADTSELPSKAKEREDEL